MAGSGAPRLVGFARPFGMQLRAGYSGGSDSIWARALVDVFVERRRPVWAARNRTSLANSRGWIARGGNGGAFRSSLPGVFSSQVIRRRRALLITRMIIA